MSFDGSTVKAGDTLIVLDKEGGVAGYGEVDRVTRLSIMVDGARYQHDGRTGNGKRGPVRLAHPTPELMEIAKRVELIAQVKGMMLGWALGGQWDNVTDIELRAMRVLLRPRKPTPPAAP